MSSLIREMRSSDFGRGKQRQWPVILSARDVDVQGVLLGAVTRRPVFNEQTFVLASIMSVEQRTCCVERRVGREIREDVEGNMA